MAPLRRGLRPAVSFGKIFQTVIFTVCILILINWWLAQASLFGQHLSSEKQTGLKLAYATLLLATNTTNTTNTTNEDSDAYFLSIRMLNYQLQHSPKTGTSKSIPFLVLATPDVEIWKRKKLAKEGATIVAVDKLDLQWMNPLAERWRDVMVKLRLFQLTAYDRILFLDADTFLLKPLDGIFSDSGVSPQKTLSVSKLELDEASLPDSYLFATLPEVRNKIHSYPPLTMPYFNAGFFLLAPSLALYSYYVSLLGLQGRFDSTYPEQNLLNYAHRLHGNMPWTRLGHQWNTNLPNMNDVQKGIASVHSKLWTMGSVLETTEPYLRGKWREVRDEMEVLYSEREDGK